MCYEHGNCGVDIEIEKHIFMFSFCNLGENSRRVFDGMDINLSLSGVNVEINFSAIRNRMFYLLHLFFTRQEFVNLCCPKLDRRRIFCKCSYTRVPLVIH